MGKKVNKAAAQEWQCEQTQLANQQRDLEDQSMLLWYAGEKQDVNYPSPDALERLGFPEVATKVRQAYNLLSEANYLFQQQCPR